MYGNSEADSTLVRTNKYESEQTRKVNLVAVGQLICGERRRSCYQEVEAAEEEKDPSRGPHFHCGRCQTISGGRPHHSLHNLFSFTDRRCLQVSGGQSGSGRQDQNQFPATAIRPTTCCCWSKEMKISQKFWISKLLSVCTKAQNST